MKKKNTVVIPIEVPAPVPLVPAPPLPPQTTEQEDIVALSTRDARDRVTEGQRRVNILWEATQGVIAVILVLTVCMGTLLDREIKNELWLLAAIVANAYFQRTNHTRVGGVGYKPEGETR